MEKDAGIHGVEQFADIAGTSELGTSTRHGDSGRVGRETISLQRCFEYNYTFLSAYTDRYRSKARQRRRTCRSLQAH